MNKDELINDPEIRLAVIAASAATQEHTGARRGQIRIGQHKWIVLLVLVVAVAVIALLGALVLSHIAVRSLFPLHLDFVLEHWS